MSQAEIIKALKKGEWMDVKEIAKKIGTKNVGLVNRSLAILFKWNEVFRMEKAPGRGYLWRGK